MSLAGGILADAAAAVVLSFEGDCAQPPPHQRISLQVLQLALEQRAAKLEEPSA